MIELVRPATVHLPGYIAALRRGWSPNTLRAVVAQEQIAMIEEDPTAFLARMDDEEAKAGPVKMPDGSMGERIPGITRWIWDQKSAGDFFCGSIGFRWQLGTSELPAHVLGHIGFAVVPWKQGQGCATRALSLIIPEARARGLTYVELTTDPENLASQKVITSNGGELIERFEKPSVYGGGEGLLFRIEI